MNQANNHNVVKEQYKNAHNLNTRISIHDKYSINKTGFGNWIVSNYDLKNGVRVLELGCGTGDMWKGHIDLLKNINLTLTDFSDGMLKTAKEKLGNLSNVSYKTVDIQNIPFEDNCFDIVIANMMLYHVPDINKGLSEVKRVLKERGTFYCATYGEHGIVEYISNLLKDYGVKSNVNTNFTLQNGKEQLKGYFSSVMRLNYEDALNVSNIDDIIDYIYSLQSMTNISNIKREILKEVLESHKANGVLHIPKEYGMFVCKNTL